MASKSIISGPSARRLGSLLATSVVTAFSINSCPGEFLRKSKECVQARWPQLLRLESVVRLMHTGKLPSGSVRCFVAMAFDYEDTDSIFNQMERTLSDIGVSLRSVNRIEHNDDIDDRIISEIERADFVIADLTYARPSVYFEAGYAQRRPVPVVYTARKDHFRPRSDDLYGNFRVHFDLQMKNIIAWADPGDAMFLRRLKARVKKVISPMLKQKRIDVEAEQRESSFRNLGVNDQFDFLRRTAGIHFKRLGFDITAVDSHHPSDASIWSLDEWARNCFHGAILGIKRAGQDLRVVLFHPVKSVDKRLCQQYRYSLVWPLGPRYILKKAKWESHKVVAEIFVCVLSGSNVIQRLAREIPNLRPGTAAHSLVCESPLLTDRLSSSKHPDRQLQVTIHVVESTRRLSNLEREIKDRMLR